MMNWKRFERKRSWSNWGTILTFARKDAGKSQKISIRTSGAQIKIRAWHLPDHYWYTTTLLNADCVL